MFYATTSGPIQGEEKRAAFGVRFGVFPCHVWKGVDHEKSPMHEDKKGTFVTYRTFETFR